MRVLLDKGEGGVGGVEVRGGVGVVGVLGLGWVVVGVNVFVGGVVGAVSSWGESVALSWAGLPGAGSSCSLLWWAIEPLCGLGSWEVEDKKFPFPQ